MSTRCEIQSVLSGLFESSRDRFADDGTTTLLDAPLIGVADAADPWFARFKHIIGPFHWTPSEALALKAPGAEARSVICWCVPIAEAVRQANRARKESPARPWSLAKSRSAKVIAGMTEGLVDHLQAKGHASAAPDRLPQHAVESSPEVGLAARWSLRHVAFVSGLGTFGISGGLITRRGIAHRLGAIVTAAAIEPTGRAYGDNAFAWCLQAAHGTCGKCIDRCPAGSVGPGVDDRDKAACRAHLGRVRRDDEHLHGCGLCQTAVPCEFEAPAANRTG